MGTTRLVDAWIFSKHPILAGAAKREHIHLHEVARQRFKQKIDGAGVNGAIAEMHPVVILFGVVFWGQLWGKTGMLISVPLMSITKVALHVWRTRRTREENK